MLAHSVVVPSRKRRNEILQLCQPRRLQHPWPIDGVPSYPESNVLRNARIQQEDVLRDVGDACLPGRAIAIVKSNSVNLQLARGRYQQTRQ